MLLGVLLIIKYGRELKACYPAGAMFILLGIWWALNTMYPNNPIIDGWLGWAVKIATGVVLLGLAVYFFAVRKKEVTAFEAEKEEKKNGGRRKGMYDNYDDYQYDDEKEDAKQRDNEAK